MKIEKINTRLYFLVFFLTFIGYYGVLLLGHSLGLSETTRKLTVPLRIFTALLLLISVIINHNKLHYSSSLILFLFFAFCYINRLLIDSIRLIKGYYMSFDIVFLYFVALSIIPFIVIVIQKVNKNQLNAIFNAFLLGGIIFVITTLYFYGQYIGKVGRLASNIVGEEVINPLILSYNSAMIIGVFLLYLLTNNVSFRKKALMIVIMGLAVIPFFLGSSRGSIFALFLPLVIYIFFLSGFKNFFKVSIVIIIVIFGLFILEEYMGSSLFSRITGTSDALKAGDHSDIRFIIWKNSFNQFLNHPLFGDTMVVNAPTIYPHNIILETLQLTGIAGFIPFIMLVIMAWRICFRIFKYNKELIWIAVIFIQAFMQNMFSLAIHTSAWFWSSMALLFSVDYYLKNRI